MERAMMIRKFTQEEDDFIRANCMTMPMNAIGRALGRSRGAAKQRAPKIGIVVPREVSEHFAKMSRIKKGDVSFNKGKKQSEYMSPEAIANCAATRFKKGNDPHNIKHDGAIMSRKDKSRGAGEYYYIRVERNKWKALNRHVWEQANGPIKRGMKVAFINGNTSDCRLQNLELVTAAELMRRNTMHTNYPKDLCLAIQLNGAMKRKINNKIKSIEK